MKKKAAILVVSFLVVAAVVAVAAVFIIKELNSTAGETVSISKDASFAAENSVAFNADDSAKLALAIGGGADSRDSIDTEKFKLPYYVRVSKGSKATVYQILLDSDNAVYYLLGGNNKLLRVDDVNFTEVLNDDSLDSFFGFVTAPVQMTVTTDAGAKTVAPSSQDWNYRKLDGSFSPISLQNQNTSVTVKSAGTAAPALSFADAAFADPEYSFIVSQNGNRVFYGDTAALAGMSFSAGQYDFEVTVTWAHHVEAPFYGKAVYAFSVKYDPKVAVTLSASSVPQGEVLAVIVTGAGDITPYKVSTSLGAATDFVQVNGQYMSLIPVSWTTTAGTYTVTVTTPSQTAASSASDSSASDLPSDSGSSSQSGWVGVNLSVTVTAVDFGTQHLTVDQETLDQTQNNEAANQEYDIKVEPLKKIYDRAKYFSGAFIMPVTGEITTEFGLVRYVNDDPTPTRHSGIDIAAPTGTPVLASNSGKVLFAAQIALTGNTVLIDHGMGIKTWYYHMNSLKVAKGDMVAKGQQLGTVGQTGFSTGPHLHFAMSVNNVYVDPWTAINSKDLFATLK